MRIRENKSIQRENNILRLSYKARYIYVYVREHQVLQLCHRQVYPFQFVRSFHFIPKRAREREREREKIALRIMCSSPWICYGFLLFRNFLYTRYYEHHRATRSSSSRSNDRSPVTRLLLRSYRDGRESLIINGKCATPRVY